MIKPPWSVSPCPEPSANGRRAECSITICKIANLSGRHHIVGVSALSVDFELTHTQESFAQNKTALSFVDELRPKRFSNQPSKVEPGLCLDLDPDDSPSAAVCARRLHLFKEHMVLSSCLPPKRGVPPWTCSGHQDPRARPCLHVPLQPCRASLSGRSASRRSFCWCCVLGGGLHLAHGQFAGPSSCFTCAAPGTAPKVVPASRLWHCVPIVGGMASHGPDGGDKLGVQSIRASVSPCWPRRTRYASTMHPAPGT